MFSVLDKYLFSHINFETLEILFCLMAVAEGVRRMGYIDFLSQRLIAASKSIRSLLLPMVLCCFFVSMLVTNDVALIIFVPFSIQVLNRIGRRDKLIKLVVLETVAANLGSMMTPFGNPQNVFLYRVYRMTPTLFFKAIFPFGLAALVLLVLIIGLDKNAGDRIRVQENEGGRRRYQTGKLLIYVLLFGLSILSVIGIVDCWILLLIVLCTILGMAAGEVLFAGKEKRKKWALSELQVLRGINYGLLLKFTVLFVLVGNVALLPIVNRFFEKIISGHEFAAGVLLSQCISNVPAAVMLSKFTSNGLELMLGTNIGGLGTLIASMASMISLECYKYAEGADKKRYIRVFTGYNLVFLVVMILIYLFFTC